MSYKRIVHNGKPHYGKHVIHRSQGCNLNLLSKDEISSFIIALCDKIDMVRFGDPFVERFGSGIEVGISAVQLIETSAITIHTNDGARELYLDVFSCKDYDEKVVEDCVRKFFEPEALDQKALYRE